MLLLNNKGSRVMLKKNMNNGQAGLCNGALGTIRKFNYGKKENIIVSIVIQFDNLIDEYELFKVSHDYEYQKNVFITRTQFPLSVAWALTIHKTQGLSLDSALMDLGCDIFEPGMAYVALSRVKKLKNVHLIDFDSSKLACDSASIDEYNRLYKKFNNGEPIISYSQWNNSSSYKSRKLTRDLVSPEEMDQNCIKKTPSKIVTDKKPKENHSLYQKTTYPKKLNLTITQKDSKSL